LPPANVSCENLFTLQTIMQQTETKMTSARQKQIVKQYLQLLDAHMQQMKNGEAEKALEIKDFAAQLFVHPGHLSNTIKEVTGQSTCDLYEMRLLDIAKELLLTSTDSIASIARRMTYDPSNFTKFFKNYTGVTPKVFRETHL
jgi:AraC family transcriptional regulator, regulatory protein of adaptative response / methylphosphotriester-DNA alkyltransferase methyltransferase